MARPLRILAAGLTYHVSARGNRKMAIVRDNVDREHLLALFGECTATHALVCHAYCFMDTHYHAVISTAHANLSRALHDLHGTYATWWNRRHRAVGHLFQGRFTAKLVQEDGYLTQVCRYVALNPVKARMVARPEEWQWSSYAATAGLRERPAFLWTDLLLGQFGALDGRAAERYKAYVEDGLTRDIKLPKRGPIIGDQAFVARFAEQLRSASREISFRGRQQPKPSLDELFQNAALRRQRNQQIVAAYRLHHYSMAEIARFLDVHPTTISKVLGRRMAGP